MHKIDKNALSFIYKIAGKKKFYIVLLLVIQVALGLLSVRFALELKDLINAAVASKSTLFYMEVTRVLGIIMAQLALRAVERYVMERCSSDLENAFKERLFSTLFSKDFGQVSSVHSAIWMNKLTSDTVVVGNAMTQIFPNLAGMVVKLVAAGVAILYLEPKFGYLIVPGGLLLVVFSYGFRRQMKTYHKRVQEKDGDLRVLLQDYLGSMAIVKTFAMNKEVVDDVDQAMKEHRKARMKKNNFSNFCNTGFSIVMNGIYLCGIFYCTHGILKGTMSYGTLMAIVQLIGQVQSPMANITSFIPRFYAMVSSAERLMEAEGLQGYSSNTMLNKKQVQEFYEQAFSSIQLQNVNFSYPNEDTNVLQDYSFCIKKKEYVAFTGHSGCGKSTVLKMMLGLYQPQQGTCALYDQEQKPYSIQDYQRLFAYVPQGNYLMSGTIRSIIAFADQKDQYNDQRIQNALTIACADSFVNALEDGVDTQLGERGLGLSEGQMQRIAIARAIYADCPILFLDESTSALDDQTEQQVLENLRSMTDKTVLIITHRARALSICDRIITFDEQGNEEIK